MSEEHNMIDAQTRVYREKQARWVKQPDKPIEAEPVVVTRRGKPLFVPGEGVLPFSTYVEATQEFCPTSSAQASVAPGASDGVRAESAPSAGLPPDATRMPWLHVRLVDEATVVDALPTRVAFSEADALPPPAFSALPNDPPTGKRSSRRFWLIGGLVLGVTLIIGCLLFSTLLLPHVRISRSQSAFAATSMPMSSTPVPTLSPTVVPAATQPPVLAMMQTPVPTGPGTFTVTPNSFSPANCEVDNGYRCTATLFYSKPGAGPLNWTAYGMHVATKFSPASGVIKPGKHQQVIIYMLTSCPNNGEFVFLNTTTNTRITLQWTCP